MEKILARDTLNKAYKKVMRNKGKPGINCMTVNNLLPYLKENGKQLCKDTLEEKYKPKSVKGIEILKPDPTLKLTNNFKPLTPLKPL